MDRIIIVHFGELSTKGDNRGLFIDCLYKNIRHRLRSFEGLEYEKAREHIYIKLLPTADVGATIDALGEIPGIQRLSLSYFVSRDIEAISAASLALLEEHKPATWKAKVKRADKSFPLDSYAIASEVGGYCLSHKAPPVDVHEPEATLNIEVRPEGAYVSLKEYPGLGGYPLGMNGKVLTLLSGGIDSPVACYQLMRRGLLVEAFHFASPPYTSLAVLDKLRDILKVLNKYQSKVRLHVVPFTKIQEAIYRYVPEPYCITIMRRMMLRLAEMGAKKYRCPAIATGEAVGQVASQTLESLRTINAVTNCPILRPLACSDKLSIIKTAKEIGTYEISIRPYEDCCTIFAPKKPKTKPRIEEAEKYEALFDFAPLLLEAIENTSDEVISDLEI